MPRTLLVEFICNEPRPDRNARRLRHRAMRRLHRARSTAAPSRRARSSPRRRTASKVTTIEGLAAPDGTLHPMQAAFKDCHGLQCGFCTPGMVMSAIDLVRASSGRRRGDDPRGARGQPVPLHRLSQHRQGGAAGRRGDEGIETDGCQRPQLHRAIGPPQGGLPLSHRRRAVHRRRQPAAPYARVFPALAARAREDPQDRHGEGEGARRAWSRSTPARISTGVNGLPCGWLITGTDGQPMKEPPHPVLAQGQGALRRRRRRAGRSPKRRTRRRTPPS
mgnify:CR=1 FL=1